MKPIDVETFLDSSIVDLDERCAMWYYGLNAFAERWDEVLKAKWMLLSIEQGQIQTEVKKPCGLLTK